MKRKCLWSWGLLLALGMTLGACHNDDTPEPLTSRQLAGTEWEGPLTKTENGVNKHTFQVHMKFNDERTAAYSYAGGGSNFSYQLEEKQLRVTNCRYSNINGTWTVTRMDVKGLKLEKKDGSVYQQFSLTRYTPAKDNKK